MTVEIEANKEAAEMASIQAGYDRVRGVEPPTEPAVETPVVEPVSDAPEVVPDLPVEEVGKDGLTDSQRKEFMAGIPDLIQFKKDTAETIRKLHGTIGELKGTIKQFQQPAEAPPAKKLSADGFKRMSAEFGPEFAEALAEDLSGITLGSDKAPGGSDDAVSKLAARIEQERLDAVVDEHPDFFEAKATPEFAAWMANQSTEFQERLRVSENPVFVSKAMTRFKADRDEAEKKAKSKEKRLEGAITPTGVPGATSSTLPDEAGVMVGYNRRKRS